MAAAPRVRYLHCVHGKQRTESVESRWEAAPAVAAAIAAQLALALVSRSEDWRLAGLPWWVWTIGAGPEALLVPALAWSRGRHRLEQVGRRRTLALALLGLVSLANAFLLVAVLTSLVRGTERSGGQLLLEAITIWTTNVLAFGLWYWAFDGGGPHRRRATDAPAARDFRFPQMEEDGTRRWQPGLLDYVYVSFTNSIAFSPTDAMPLTRWAKLLMMAESALSALTILLVAARAVNIFR